VRNGKYVIYGLLTTVLPSGITRSPWNGLHGMVGGLLGKPSPGAKGMHRSRGGLREKLTGRISLL